MSVQNELPGGGLGPVGGATPADPAPARPWFWELVTAPFRDIDGRAYYRAAARRRAREDAERGNREE